MMGSRNKEEPQRSCIGCRKKRRKSDLIRLVRRDEEPLEWDFSRHGKAPGRGAYICPRLSCWKSALKRKAVGRSLRTGLSEADIDVLTSQLERSGVLEDEQN